MSVTAALSRDAYAMSHLSAEACVQRLAAGRGDGYQVTGISLQQNGRALDERSSGEATSVIEAHDVDTGECVHT